MTNTKSSLALLFLRRELKYKTRFPIKAFGNDKDEITGVGCLPVNVVLMRLDV